MDYGGFETHHLCILRVDVKRIIVATNPVKKNYFFWRIYDSGKYCTGTWAGKSVLGMEKFCILLQNPVCEWGGRSVYNKNVYKLEFIKVERLKHLDRIRDATVSEIFCAKLKIWWGDFDVQSLRKLSKTGNKP